MPAWDVATGHETGRADLGDRAWDIALFDHERAFVAVTESNTLSRWNAATLTAFGDVQHDSLRDAVTVGDYALDAGPTAITLASADGRETDETPLNLPHIATAAGNWVAVSSSNLELNLFDKTLKPIRNWHAHRSVQQIRLRPDGAILATADGTRHVRLWDPETGSVLVESPELPAMILQLAWSPDGRRLAIAGFTGTVWVWELAPPAAPLAAFAACVSPWQLVDGLLVARDLDPTRCTGVLR